MIYFIVVIYMAITSAWSGGSLYGHQWFGKYTFIPEILFALGIALAFVWALGLSALSSVAAFIAVILWSYGWMQAATANGLHWGDGVYKPERDTSFSPIVNWISDYLKLDRSSRNYCRIYMAVKGFLISLPVGGLGVVFWPLGYEIGHKFKNNTIRELLAGAWIGVLICVFLAVV